MTSTYQLGPANGQLVLRTYREGMAAKIGHDLTLTVAHWNATVTAPDDAAPDSGVPDGLTLEATIDTTSLSVTAATGGVKPLSDRDRKDIVGNARKAMNAARHPQAAFRTTRTTPTSAGATLDGILRLNGVENPVQLTVTRKDGASYRAAGQITQTAFGVKPYSAFFGALTLRDTVDVEITIELPAPSS